MMYTLILFLCNVLLSIQGYTLTQNLLDNTYHDLDQAEKIFEHYIEKYEKKYENENEYEHKFNAFKENLKIINKHNKLIGSKMLGINDFSDLSYDEFYDIYLNKYTDKEAFKKAVPYKTQFNAPDSFDWRSKNVVTEVKNQGHCGSCYVFSAIGSLEGQYAKLHNNLISLSEQQGLDCDLKGNCTGGLYSDVWEALVREGGSMKEEDYPYYEAQGQCHTDKNKIAAIVTASNLYNPSSEEDLRDAVYNNGPISAAVHVDNQFKAYPGGYVYDPPSNGGPNHAILLVGYGIDDKGTQYWIIKNSWGQNWGEKGYMRLVRGKNAANIIAAPFGFPKVM